MLYIFDKDGTLVSGMGDRPANTPEEQHVLPNVLEKIQALRLADHRIAIASNQGGVAWGFITYEEAVFLVSDCADKIGGVDAFRMCPFDPKASAKHTDSEYAYDAECRKPRPGMLINIMRELGFSPDDTVMIGDMESDKQAAQNAGCHFFWAKDFFDWKEADQPK